jgi:hypothetical protein
LKRKTFRSVALLGALGVALVSSATAQASPSSPIPTTGPSTSVNPVVLPTASSVEIMSLLTVNDPTKTATNGFEMVGIPDGLGAYQPQAGGDITVLNNQELGATQGITRAHGQKGTFVTKYTLDPATLEVKTGADFIQNTVQYYDYGTGTYGAAPTAPFVAAFGRFCSSDLATETQLYNPGSGNGYNGKIYFANEETGSEGRTMGVDMSGNAVQLPRLGLASWENTLVANTGTDTTLSIGDDDTTPSPSSGPTAFSLGGYLRVHVGTKTNAGTPFDMAGLTNGTLSAIKVSDAVFTDKQFRTTYGKFDSQPFTLAGVDWNQTGALQATAMQTAHAMSFYRPEDGAWDPQHPNDFYFVTTDQQGQSGKGGLWKLHFTDLNNPSAGGTLTLLLDGTEGVFFPDNLTIDHHGHILINEDPGANNYVARMWAYNIPTTQLLPIATFDPAKFAVGANNWTVDEESSGVIDAESTLGAGWFLFDAQIHTAGAEKPEGVPAALPAGTGPGTTEEFVEQGQLLAMKIGDFQEMFDHDPAPVTPEVPLAVILPLTGIVIGGGLLLLQRRRALVRSITRA